MNRRNFTFRAILAVALLGAIVWLGLHREVLQAAALEQELARFGASAPILFVLLYASATVLFVPGAVLTLAGGALFGPIWGTLWNLTGATLGATLAFVIARYVASDWIAARSGERLGRLMRGVEAGQVTRQGGQNNAAPEVANAASPKTWRIMRLVSR